MMGKIPVFASNIGLVLDALLMLLANSEATETEIKNHGGWNTSSVADNYFEDPIENKKLTSNRIFSREFLLRSSLLVADSEDIEVSNLNVTFKKSCVLREVFY